MDNLTMSGTVDASSILPCPVQQPKVCTEHYWCSRECSITWDGGWFSTKNHYLTMIRECYHCGKKELINTPVPNKHSGMIIAQSYLDEDISNLWRNIN